MYVPGGDNQMTDAIWSKDPVNIGRQHEIDLLKAFSIIMMIITHCIDDLYPNYEESIVSCVINDVLAQTVGAAGFMICMGIGIAYAAHSSSKVYVSRGLGLLVIGQVLNLFRYALPSLILYGATGNEGMRDMGFLTFSGDILQFAGLFFVFMGLFSMMKLKPAHIFIVSIVFNLIGGILSFHVDTGIYAVDQMLGLFVCTSSESYFPLFHWMIYPAFGIVFGEVLRHITDKKKFYGYLLVPTLIVWGVYYYIAICVDQHVFRFYNEWKSLAYVNPADALVQCICNFSMVCVFFFITSALPGKCMGPVNFVSKNINRYYCVHSVIIYWIGAFMALFDISDENVTAPVCYGMALGVVVVTTLLILLYKEKLRNIIAPFFERHAYIWAVIVIILSIAACWWASVGTDVFPNIFNDYAGWM